MPQNYNEETLAQLAGIYGILNFLEKNKSYPVSFGLRYASSLVISSLLQKLIAVIIIVKDPYLKPFMSKLEVFRNAIAVHLPNVQQGFDGVTRFGSKLQEEKLNPIPIFEEYFKATGKFLHTYTGGFVPEDRFLNKLPTKIIKCVIEDTKKPLESSALSSFEELVRLLYPGNPGLAEPGFYEYIKALPSTGAVQSGKVFLDAMQHTARSIHIAKYGVPNENDYRVLSQLTEVPQTALKNVAQRADVMSKLYQLKQSVRTPKFPELLKEMCDTTYALFVMELILSAGKSAANTALNLLAGLTSLSAHVLFTSAAAVMPKPDFLRPSFSPDIVAALQNLEQNPDIKDIQALYKNLKAIQDNKIPWECYINRTVAILFSVLFIAFLFNILTGEYNLGSIPWLTGPILSQGASSAARSLHYYTFGNIDSYTKKTTTLLTEALLLTPEKKLATDFELIVAKTIDGKKQELWDQVQCVFRAKQSSKKTRREINTIIATIAPLLEAYNIQYVLVSAKSNRTALYINAASAYQALTTWRASAHSNVAAIAQKLELELMRLSLTAKLKQVFEALRKKNIVANYWFDDKPNSIDYEVLDGKEWNAFLATCPEFSKCMKKTRFSCTISEATVTNLINAVQTSLGVILQPVAGLAAPSVPSAARQRKPTKSVAVTPTVAAAPEPAVVIAAHNWTLPNNAIVTSNDDRIVMIFGTQHYDNPIFVMNALNEEDFNSPFTYDAACTQLENPRLAAPRGQQGLFITNNQQTITLKLLGRQDARGNVRCNNQHPPVVSNLGSSLYVINSVDNNAHE